MVKFNLLPNWHIVFILKDTSRLRERMEVIVERILVDNLPHFTSYYSNCRTDHIENAHTADASKRTEIVWSNSKYINHIILFGVNNKNQNSNINEVAHSRTNLIIVHQPWDLFYLCLLFQNRSYQQFFTVSTIATCTQIHKGLFWQTTMLNYDTQIQNARHTQNTQE